MLACNPRAGIVKSAAVLLLVALAACQGVEVVDPGAGLLTPPTINFANYDFAPQTANDVSPRPETVELRGYGARVRTRQADFSPDDVSFGLPENTQFELTSSSGIFRPDPASNNIGTVTLNPRQMNGPEAVTADLSTAVQLTEKLGNNWDFGAETDTAVFYVRDRSNTADTILIRSDDYEYVSFYYQSFAEPNGIDVTVELGTLGQISRPTDVGLATGTITYTGFAAGYYIDDSSRSPLLISLNAFGNKSGSTVTADFGANTVKVELDFSFERNSMVQGQPVNKITVDNMRISGNGYSGGTVSATREVSTGGSIIPPVNVAIQPNTLTAEGHFFGPSASGAPAETGGRISFDVNIPPDGSVSFGRSVTAIFVADQ